MAHPLRYDLSQRLIMATMMVHIRVDQKTKERATKTLAAMGMSVSDAVRMLLVRVVAESPNATTVKAMRAAGKGQGSARSPRTSCSRTWESIPCGTRSAVRRSGVM